jgi:hypothetical protein
MAKTPKPQNPSKMNKKLHKINILINQTPSVAGMTSGISLSLFFYFSLSGPKRHLILSFLLSNLSRISKCLLLKISTISFGFLIKDSSEKHDKLVLS